RPSAQKLDNDAAGDDVPGVRAVVDDEIAFARGKQVEIIGTAMRIVNLGNTLQAFHDGGIALVIKSAHFLQGARLVHRRLDLLTVTQSALFVVTRQKD